MDYDLAQAVADTVEDFERRMRAVIASHTNITGVEFSALSRAIYDTRHVFNEIITKNGMPQPPMASSSVPPMTTDDRQRW